MIARVVPPCRQPNALASLSARAGLSLVELVIALMLLSMALVSLAGATALAQRSLAAAETTERITRDAAGLLDSLAAAAAVTSGQQAVHGVEYRWSVSGDSIDPIIELLAEAHDGTRAVSLRFEVRRALR